MYMHQSKNSIIFNNCSVLRINSYLRFQIVRCFKYGRRPSKENLEVEKY